MELIKTLDVSGMRQSSSKSAPIHGVGLAGPTQAIRAQSPHTQRGSGSGKCGKDSCCGRESPDSNEKQFSFETPSVETLMRCRRLIKIFNENNYV